MSHPGQTRLKAVIECAKQCPSCVTPQEIAVVERLASDQRASIAWKLIEQNPDQVIAFCAAVVHALRAPRLWQDYLDRELQHLHDIEAALAAVESLRKNPVFAKVKISVKISAWHDMERYEADEHPEAHLAWAREVTKVTIEGIPRKSKSAARITFMSELPRFLNSFFGRPHYEVVAALASIFFASEDDCDEDISADAVKKASRRARLRFEADKAIISNAMSTRPPLSRKGRARQ